MNKFLSDIEVFLDSGLLLFAIFVSSSLCSLLLILTNKRKSFFFWVLRWIFVMFLLTHRYFKSILDQNIPFASPTESPIFFVFITLVFLFFDLMTGNSNRMKKTNTTKFTVVDYGEFVDEDLIRRRVFYLGKPVRDINGTPKFCKLFTLVFSK